MLTKVILQANIDKVAKYFERADKIVIVTHVSPDGDALGSSLGLFHFLETQEKNVHVIVPNAFPLYVLITPCAASSTTIKLYFLAMSIIVSISQATPA